VYAKSYTLPVDHTERNKDRNFNADRDKYGDSQHHSLCDSNWLQHTYANRLGNGNEYGNSNRIYNPYAVRNRLFYTNGYYFGYFFWYFVKYFVKYCGINRNKHCDKHRDTYFGSHRSQHWNK